MDKGQMARRIDDALKRKNWSTYKLAEVLAAGSAKAPSYSTLRNYRSGASLPSAGNLQLIADALEVPVGSLTGESERVAGSRTTGAGWEAHTGAIFAVIEKGRLQLSGTEEELEAFGVIVMGVDRATHLPWAAKDVITRFLYDLRFAYGEDQVGDEAAVAELVERFFPRLAFTGSYGEAMAGILGQAQLAYLSAFGSGAGVTPPETGAEKESAPRKRGRKNGVRR